MSPHRVAPEKKKPSPTRVWPLVAGIAVIAVVGLLIAVSVLSQPAAPASLGAKSKGDAKAPIAIVEYSDFQ